MQVDTVHRGFLGRFWGFFRKKAKHGDETDALIQEKLAIKIGEEHSSLDSPRVRTPRERYIFLVTEEQSRVIENLNLRLYSKKDLISPEELQKKINRIRELINNIESVGEVTLFESEKTRINKIVTSHEGLVEVNNKVRKAGVRLQDLQKALNRYISNNFNFEEDCEEINRLNAPLDNLQKQINTLENKCDPQMKKRKRQVKVRQQFKGLAGAI